GEAAHEGGRIEAAGVAPARHRLRADRAAGLGGCGRNARVRLAVRADRRASHGRPKRAPAVIGRVVAGSLILVLRAVRVALTPFVAMTSLTPRTCKYEPSCSCYAEQAI